MRDRSTTSADDSARGARARVAPLPFRDAVALEIDRGAKEIVLTGVDITDYEDGLGNLCQRLLAADFARVG